MNWGTRPEGLTSTILCEELNTAKSMAPDVMQSGRIFASFLLSSTRERSLLGNGLDALVDLISPVVLVSDPGFQLLSVIRIKTSVVSIKMCDLDLCFDSASRKPRRKGFSSAERSCVARRFFQSRATDCGSIGCRVLTIFLAALHQRLEDRNELTG
jgi:hypothetical protein